MSLPLDISPRKRSISESYPCFIIEPSFTEIGGSSTIAASIKVSISIKLSILLFISTRSFDFAQDKTSLISGNLEIVKHKERNSLAFADP